MSTILATHDGFPDDKNRIASRHDNLNLTIPDLKISQNLDITGPHPKAAQPFRFFDLPAEIRCMILGHALEFEFHLKPRSHRSDKIQFWVDVRLLATNRRM